MAAIRTVGRGFRGIRTSGNLQGCDTRTLVQGRGIGATGIVIGAASRSEQQGNGHTDNGPQCSPHKSRLQNRGGGGYVGKQMGR